MALRMPFQAVVPTASPMPPERLEAMFGNCPKIQARIRRMITGASREFRSTVSPGVSRAAM